MNLLIIFLAFGNLSIISSLPANDASKSTNIPDSIQLKRDLSLSYAATDIGSKDGSRAKTITVIKNVSGKKDASITVDPKLHQNENWGSQFRDNFNSYGVIPDVPDIDELFDFVNKKEDKIKPETEKDIRPVKESKGKDKIPDKRMEDRKEKEVTSSPAPIDEVTDVDEVTKEEKVEKISGDAEIIQPPGKQGKVKSQSLDLGKYSVREILNDDSTPKNSIEKHSSNHGNKNDKYILPPALPYNYPDPNLKGYLPSNGFSPQIGRGSITVTTPSGRSFDIPLENATANHPYLAPNFRRNQNSLPGQQFSSSSQRPYVAPNLRKTYEVQLNNTVTGVLSSCAPNATSNKQQPTFNVYRNIPTNIKTNDIDGYKPSIPRSRGLRY